MNRKESVLEKDKRIVYEMCAKHANFCLMSTSETDNTIEFGVRAGIINKLNFMTVIKRLRNALTALYLEDKCERDTVYKGYTYNFSKSFGKEYGE
jgi:hypothetical protein